ncbi:MAG: DNA topoisomerase I [Candidatus Thermoplasmatota archaeon]|jgi:DNA topoisomerase-1|nr:DNA topoisomerase I [Candidatus Thermoplasmatota archaeon]
MKLVICEKNIAARRIASILSQGKAKSTKIGVIPVYEFEKDNEKWVVIGLKGHIINVDYPAGFNRWTKIPPHELIDVEPIKKVSEKGIANALKSLVDKNPFVIIATDYDREGELIGVEAVNLLREYNKNITQIKRAKFSAITPYEINKAFDNLTDVDYNLSNAGEARQIIDLVWGAVLTRFISLTSRRLGKDFLSIGRVQSPTLALLVDREKEIKNFKPKPFWQIIAKLEKGKQFDAVHIEGNFWDEQKAQDVYNKIKGVKKAFVKNVDKKVEHEMPPSPFNTTTFLQAASGIGFSAAKAMSVAEELYMLGLISYPRTDNTVYPPSLNIRAILEKLASSSFSKEAQEVIMNGREHPTRGKKYATDHPPIHPVGVPSDGKLHSEQKTIYELICRRFLATLAKDAVSETTDVSLDISGENFKASGYKLIEPNWKKIYTYFRERKNDLPDLFEGETIDVLKVQLKEDSTKPPQRYTQGSLIAKMEQLLLGTKSTRHEIISKLYSRKYILGSQPIPTSTAIAVVEALGDCDVVKPKMTAQLEKDMNDIAEGKKTLEETVKESREMLTKVMKTLELDKEKIKTNIKKAIKEQNNIGKCPKCGKNLVVRVSKKGKRFVGCTGYPDCNNTYSLPQEGGVFKIDAPCSKCGFPVVKVKTKGNRYWNMCLNPVCPGKKQNKKPAEPVKT